MPKCFQIFFKLHLGLKKSTYYIFWLSQLNWKSIWINSTSKLFNLSVPPCINFVMGFHVSEYSNITILNLFWVTEENMIGVISNENDEYKKNWMILKDHIANFWHIRYLTCPEHNFWQKSILVKITFYSKMCYFKVWNFKSILNNELFVLCFLGMCNV